jgi:hypothetical protein
MRVKGGEVSQIITLIEESDIEEEGFHNSDMPAILFHAGAFN